VIVERLGDRLPAASVGLLHSISRIWMTNSRPCTRESLRRNRTPIAGQRRKSGRASQPRITSGQCTSARSEARGSIRARDRPQRSRPEPGPLVQLLRQPESLLRLHGRLVVRKRRVRQRKSLPRGAAVHPPGVAQRQVKPLLHRRLRLPHASHAASPAATAAGCGRPGRATASTAGGPPRGRASWPGSRGPVRGARAPIAPPGAPKAHSTQAETPRPRAATRRATQRPSVRRSPSHKAKTSASQQRTSAGGRPRPSAQPPGRRSECG
jgi:hypothetical protein